jgi:hypothetical protein
MILNFQIETDVVKGRDKLEFFIKNGYTVDLTKKGNTRTTRQNSALHLLFTIVSSQLNEMGVEYKYFGLKGQVLEMRHTPKIVKDFIWRPIQIALFDIESTRKINTEQINEIVDVLVKFFSERGIVIQFPSKEQLEQLIK